MSTRIVIALLFLTTASFAAPVVTSIEPDRGPVQGGITVTIHGTGFSNNCNICSPPFGPPNVFFGPARSTSVTFIDANTLQAVTPPLLPQSAAVVVQQFEGGSSNGNVTFTSEGNPQTAFDPVLLPIFLPPVRGAFGSEFHTVARLSNRGKLGAIVQMLPVYGVDLRCTLADPPPAGPLIPIYVKDEDQQLSEPCGPSVARLLYVPKGEGRALAANIRVLDLTREAESNGVEIPVVREGDFRTDRLVFMGVPADSRFRVKLRLYSLARAAEVRMGVDLIQLRPRDPQDIFDPAYAEIDVLPPAGRIVVDSDGQTPIWGLITVTNNQTQEITTITGN